MRYLSVALPYSIAAQLACLKRRAEGPSTTHLFFECSMPFSDRMQPVLADLDL